MPTRQPSVEILSTKVMVWIRDGYRRTRCGMTGEEHVNRYGRTLEVHRLTPGSWYTLEGCVTLRIPCHAPEPKRPRGARRTQDGVYVARIRERLAKAAEARASELDQDFTQYANDAVRMRLESESRWPPKS